MDAVELLLHPVRLRIVHSLAGARELTTTDLIARLPGVSKVTVYRQVALLVEGGFVEVASEQRARGAVERRYRLRQDRPVLDGDVAAAMTLQDHRQGFAAAMAVLIAEFNAYLDHDGADPTADSVSYRQTTVWLSPEELTEMRNAILQALQGQLANTSAPGRAPYLLSAILFPTDQPDPRDTGR